MLALALDRERAGGREERERGRERLCVTFVMKPRGNITTKGYSQVNGMIGTKVNVFVAQLKKHYDITVCDTMLF